MKETKSIFNSFCELLAIMTEEELIRLGYRLHRAGKESAAQILRECATLRFGSKSGRPAGR